jgi:hypothetical protein
MSLYAGRALQELLNIGRQVTESGSHREDITPLNEAEIAEANAEEEAALQGIVDVTHSDDENDDTNDDNNANDLLCG